MNPDQPLSLTPPVPKKRSDLVVLDNLKDLEKLLKPAPEPEPIVQPTETVIKHRGRPKKSKV